MASSTDSDGEQVVPEEDEEGDVRAVQARYLRSPSPSQYSMMSDSYTASIFMEPIHLSSAVAAKKIINEELKSKEVRPPSTNQDMLESAEQLMVEDLYNRIKEKIDDRSLFNTPCVMDLQRVLMGDRLESPMNSVDEVWPNVFIAEKSVAVNKGRLKRMGISHILNAGHGTGVFTGAEFYTGMDIHYLGIEVDDFPESDISKHLRKGAEFLDEALLTYRGKVLVNSVMGISRSAVLVAAYLMIFHHMTILEALMTIRKKRAIYPNDGFLKQLRELNDNLLEEREEFEQEESGDEDSMSQSSVLEARAHSITVQEEDSGSVMGAKAHSITVQEEETSSVMGSVMSSVAHSSVVSKQPTLIDEDEEEKLYEEWRVKQGLPPREVPQKMNEGKELRVPDQASEEDDDDIRKMIYEWQCRNEKYQSSGLEDEDGDSVMGGRRYSPSEFSDVESVSSLDIRLLKQQLEASGINRMRRGRNDSESTEDSTWDIWNKRIQEIEKEAIKRSDAGYSKDEGPPGNARKERDIDEESLFSETNSLYNFCKKNKDKLTALERWRIKRIQYGLHKKDSQGTETPKGEESADQGEAQEKNLTDANLTAYQTWKMRRQKKVGNENKDEIVDLAKGEDTASAKRKQRREEILERSKKTLEESQSICGLETETAMSGSIPLTAFLPSMLSGMGGEDSGSVLSMQSNRSRLSQATGASGMPQVPTIPLPNITPGAGDAISVASIQNWIANVVCETIAQKQNEILMMSRAPSVMSSNLKSSDHGRNTEDDKMSLLSMQSSSSFAGSMSRQRDLRNADNQSMMSCDSSLTSSVKGKITQTSKPLYSLFVDDIDLKELNKKEKELKMELSGKMSEYKKEKIATDNKRSTLFKKKKAKDDEEKDEEEAVDTRSGNYRHLSNRDIDRTETVSAFSGYVSKDVRSSVDSSVEKWLSDLKTDGKTTHQDRTETTSQYTRRACTREATSEISSDRIISSRTAGLDSLPSHQIRSNSYRATSAFSSASREDTEFTRCTRETTRSKKDSPEPFFFQATPESGSRPDTPESATNDTREHRFEESEVLPNGDASELGVKRRFNQSFASDTDRVKEDNSTEEESDPLGRWSQYRKSTNEQEDMDDDDIIAAWRNKQDETKAKLQRRRKRD
ncbi:serine/threonine/tyrosine-interacting-like protein 2 [Ambystoma mexicanum]|uniref:serine/threonine/tyrosine-interacting-like protein 2 n=1 Tax=Ambystoma mexicanum TaxID=8296 RepID=UPI0037E87DD5